MKPNASTPATWSIDEAIAQSYQEFSRRLGADLLWGAFELLTLDRKAVLMRHQVLARELDQYLQYPLNYEGASLAEWMGNARAAANQAELLLHVGVRWWRARDDMLLLPAEARVPCVYAEGLGGQVSLQLLKQMLYLGKSPDTAQSPPDQTPPTRGSRA